MLPRSAPSRARACRDRQAAPPSNRPRRRPRESCTRPGRCARGRVCCLARAAGRTPRGRSRAKPAQAPASWQARPRRPRPARRRSGPQAGLGPGCALRGYSSSCPPAGCAATAIVVPVACRSSRWTMPSANTIKAPMSTKARATRTNIWRVGMGGIQRHPGVAATLGHGCRGQGTAGTECERPRLAFQERNRPFSHQNRVRVPGWPPNRSAAAEQFARL